MRGGNGAHRGRATPDENHAGRDPDLDRGAADDSPAGDDVDFRRDHRLGDPRSAALEAAPSCAARRRRLPARRPASGPADAEDARTGDQRPRSEEHTSELQSLMRISYAVFCLKKTKTQLTQT